MRVDGVGGTYHPLACRSQLGNQADDLIIENRLEGIVERITFHLRPKHLFHMGPILCAGKSAIHEGELIVQVVGEKLLSIEIPALGNLAEHRDVLHHDISHIKEEQRTRIGYG
ncbi:hypothetical protein SDC9_113584 [bioreactor metagenome]|uniref:Uncharacterized protein n=1 Tax=bioreactor metagenome TaxID=1076179 RepID=A0A645BY93_9ZZZZ